MDKLQFSPDYKYTFFLRYRSDSPPEKKIHQNREGARRLQLFLILFFGKAKIPSYELNRIVEHKMFPYCIKTSGGLA